MKKNINIHQQREEIKKLKDKLKDREGTIKQQHETIKEHRDEIGKKDDAIKELQQLLMQQSAEIEKLTKRLNKDSSNSSKPPSSDGLKKRRTQSLREKGVNPSGGQKGHAGKTLQQVSNPDHIERHLLDSCPQCSSSLTDVEVDRLKTEVPEKNGGYFYLNI